MNRNLFVLMAGAALIAAAATSTAHAQRYDNDGNRGYDGYRNDRGDRYFDEEDACQDRVRQQINARNRGRVDVDFRGRVRKEELGSGRERIRGAGIASVRDDSSRFGYECVVDDRRNVVVTASYQVRERGELR